MLRVFSPNKREVPLRGMGDVSLAELFPIESLSILDFSAAVCCRSNPDSVAVALDDVSRDPFFRVGPLSPASRNTS